MKQFMGLDVLVCDSSQLRTLQSVVDYVYRHPHETYVRIHSKAYREMVRADETAFIRRDVRRPNRLRNAEMAPNKGE